MRKHQAIFLYALVIIASLLVIMFIYRFQFEFDNYEVSRIIREEADEYDDCDEVYKLIHESVKSILRDEYKVRMIRRYARVNGMSNEQVLVDTAVVQAQNLQYIA